MMNDKSIYGERWTHMVTMIHKNRQGQMDEHSLGIVNCWGKDSGELNRGSRSSYKNDMFGNSSKRKRK